ncbi:MAG: ribonuclease H-like domain-containing protein [Candidatus Methanofastidiosia archaeon]|jgi:uncharacterized protein YprB with RNaseH-like and TPR domain
MVEDEELLKRIGKTLKNSVEKAKDTECENTHFSTSSISQDFSDAFHLKHNLLQEYQDTSLEDVVPGKEYDTGYGTCYRIESHKDITVTRVNQEDAHQKILENLKLVRGIGNVTEHNLKNKGYKTIKDLINHPQFGPEARKALTIDMGDTPQVLDWMEHWLPKSHPLILYSSSFCNLEKFLMVDIETMGLFSRPIVLCGVAEIKSKTLAITQYLIRDISEELAALSGFLSHIDESSMFVTFNGKSFDIPYIQQRLIYYGVQTELKNPHFDLLHFSRRAWKEYVPDCSLTTLEQYVLGITRENDVPSALVPHFYDTYIETKNVGPLIPIIEHNKQDIFTLAHIFFRLYEEWT